MDKQKEKLLDEILGLIHDLRHNVYIGNDDKTTSISLVLDQVVKVGKDTGLI